MKSIDQIDFLILGHLQKQRKRSYSDIARCLDVSEGMVRSRVNRMLDEGVFEYMVHTNPNKIGLEVQVIIGLSIALGEQDSVAAKLAKYSEIRFIGAFSGQYDLMLQAYFQNYDKLILFVNEDLAKIKSIQHVDLNVELKQYKDSFS
ncbi:Lrp/AsnC family transcriptional regulator [Salsuginibacillus kocurii]|uniref:Lrp/AsnC family transcriptional regulator n=1 Tax=Salsuginibacillus kocurii TaxID=427078 RepID=UPI000369CBB1|nr:Lrp/AsnC family transcriptional regulator [Salsuginibacillus kocurii]